MGCHRHLLRGTRRQLRPNPVRGKRKSVAFWDDEAGRGVVMIENEVHPLNGLDPPWPQWTLRVDDLNEDLAKRTEAASA